MASHSEHTFSIINHSSYIHKGHHQSENAKDDKYGIRVIATQLAIATKLRNYLSFTKYANQVRPRFHDSSSSTDQSGLIR